MDKQTKKIKKLTKQTNIKMDEYTILNKQIKGLGDKQEYGQMDK